MSRKTGEPLYMMDSTTISFFANILKGCRPAPQIREEEGGMKVHTVMKYRSWRAVLRLFL